MTDVAGAVPDVEAVSRLLDGVGYLADTGLASALFCAVRLPQPILLEGEAGVGKTEAAKALAEALDTPLVRLQCYEGIDASEALYEWNYPRQLLAIRVAESAGRPLAEADLFGPEYLIARPLLRAVQHEGPRPIVLLIDEIDRADDEFEAFLFELLAESTVTIPEIGTIRAAQPPIVVITSNRTREIHDALKRRCFYYWVDYPTADRELEILKRKAPRASDSLSREVVEFVQKLRKMDLFKLPGIAETIDWTEALMQLDALELAPQAINDTLGVLLKYQDDIARIQGSEAAKLLELVKAEIAAAPREQ
jgi:MoxR-like ATPase